MIVLLGKTCAGKDCIKKELLKIGYKSIVTYTTRPIRPGEQDGVDYHFISKYKFFILNLFGFFAETTSYKVANGETWRYGTSKKSIEENKDGVIILNPKGLEAIKKLKGIDIFSVLLDISPMTQRKRLLDRGDNIKESDRRINADANAFIGMKYKVDFILFNDNLNTPFKIAQIIHQKYSTRKEESKKWKTK